MSNSKENSKGLLRLLSKFFNEGFEIVEEAITMSWEFLFENKKHPDLDKYPDLLQTLNYLKRVQERNRLNKLDDLVLYYDNKRTRVNELFKKLEEIDPEECMALHFRMACAAYVTPVKAEHISKQCIYYPLTHDSNVTVGFENISYRDTIEEEIEHLARIQGNHLLAQMNVCCISAEKISQIVSN